jgi:non-specific serine/threonine protein kinase/serine/threonine-protein kinase
MDAAGEISGGERIGPFRLRRLLGEGGMGVVWEAVQDGPVQRRVALKWIQPGMDSAQVLARFDSERQALALMNHPAIAQVYDAGRTPDGRPYFAMEYVEGSWITRYCDAERLSLPARLDLFLSVCGAVQHAHQKGVIHRDLKPSNILVQTEDDGRANPKIIDFGVAKATGPQLSDRTPVTRLGQFIGTPAYMSPEQAGPAGFDVDTRSDVYSLGVLLYELLSGRLPFERPDGDADALRRSIREDDPPRPSARVASLGADALEVAHHRGLEPVAHTRALRGGLDWIVMKALSKDRNQRYGSADELAADLRRYLEHRPVIAGPPGVGYRVGKFVRRHRVGASAGSVIAILLVATAIGTTVQARRLAVERDRANKEASTAQAALGFLTDTFRLSDPEQVRGETITAREILDRGAAKIEREMTDAPEAQADLILAIGRTYANLGLFARAEPLLRRGAALRRETLSRSDPRIYEAMTELSDILRQRDAFDEAEALAREAQTTLESLPGASDTAIATAHLRLGEVLTERGKFDDAEPHLRSAVERFTRSLGGDDSTTLQAATALADCLSRHGKYAEADPILRTTLATQRRLYGSDDPNTIPTLNALAINARGAGLIPEAEALYREQLGTLRRVLGNDHPSTLTAAANLGVLLVQTGQLDEAEPLLWEALEGRRRNAGARSLPALGTLTEWAALQRDRGDLEKAERAFREALDGFRAAVGDDHPQTMRVMNNLGHLLKERGRLREAEPYYRSALDGASRVLGPSHPNTLASMGNLGELLALQGRASEGLPLVTTALEEVRKALPPTHILVGQTLRKYGLCLTRLGRYAEAEAALLEAHDIVRTAVGETNIQTRAVAHDLVALYEAWGKPDRTAPWRAAEGKR